ncbi:hypothetical protein TWF694_003804 [Orbilia ellipsospora]|uniref:DUF7689 domain-containing protein n=1 Tax=Orbilia ellipsospora TaxID=2528407 RepID=A0AAV9X0L6_9PEZI
MPPLTQQEWNHLNPPANFPKLKYDQCSRTAIEDPTYNCISWFLNLPFVYQGQVIQPQWVNPPVDAAHRDQYLAAARLVSCHPEDIGCVARLYGGGTPYLHGDRWNGTNLSWESKMGQLVRMLHQEKALTDDGIYESIYGNLSFWCRRLANAEEASSDPVLLAEDFEIPDVTNEEESINRITDSLSAAYGNTANTFDVLFAAWKNTWFLGAKLSVSQNSQDRASGAAWDAVVAYARRVNVLPQIVQKLNDPTNVFGVHLYNAAQTDQSKKVDPRDTFNYYFLKNQVIKIQKFFGTSIQEFTTQADEWQTHQANAALSSTSTDYFNSPAYGRLVAMGTPIVPLIMERYSRDRNGWWHELLYHIVNGQASGSMMFQKEELFEYWKAQYDIGLE